MFFVKENTDSINKINRDAPEIGEPYVTVEKRSIPFYESNHEMNQIVGGYRKGPKNSYAKDLMRKYPLSGE